MTTSNQNPASQNTAASTPSQPEHYSALLEIQEELMKSNVLTGFHRTWVKKCYDSNLKKPVRSIQNAIRILSLRSRQHLQKAKAIADHIGEQNTLYYECIEFAEADMLILADPLFEVDPENVLALLLLIDDFSRNAEFASEVLMEKIKKLEGNGDSQQGNFDKTQVNFSSVDPLSPRDSETPAILDIAHAEIQMLCSLLNKDDGRILIKSFKVFQKLLKKTAICFENILAGDDIDSDLRQPIQYALNHLDFINLALKKAQPSEETAKKYRWSISCVLSDALISAHEAAETANRNQANAILKSRRGDAVDTLH